MTENFLSFGLQNRFVPASHGGPLAARTSLGRPQPEADSEANYRRRTGFAARRLSLRVAPKSD
jgi:hypothetical protein